MTWFASKQPEYNDLHHLQIIVPDAPHCPTVDELAFHVTHMQNEKPVDWLFDSFLLLPIKSPSGSMFYADVNRGTTRCGDGDFYAIVSPNPATSHDWIAGLDYWFGKDGVLQRLNTALKRAEKKLGKAPHIRNVVISIPYPHPNQAMFGSFKGKTSLNFSVVAQNLDKANQQRLEACRWFVDEAMRRINGARFSHLNLLGFYWIYESLRYSWDVDDHWVLKELYRYIRSLNTRLFWIPFYSSFNVNLMKEARGFYFDCIFLQPNHMFYQSIEGVDKAAEEARERGGGIEIEYYMDLPAHLGVGREKAKRLHNYLAGGVKHGYMKEAVCAYFLGFNDLHKMAKGKPAEQRAYNSICEFVRGVYRPR